MALTTNKFILPNGAPSGGNQPTQSSTWGEVSGKLDNGIINYTNTDGLEGNILTSDGAGNLTLRPMPTTNSFLIKAETTSQVAPPSNKRLKWNNATQLSSTKLFIDYTTLDNIDISDYIQDIMIAGTRVTIQLREDQSQYQIFDIISSIDQTSFIEINVIPISSAGGNFSNNRNILVIANTGYSQVAESTSFLSFANTSTQTGPPGNKFTAWNNATQSSASKLFISHTDIFFKAHKQLLESISKIGTLLIIFKKNVPDICQTWKIEGITPQTEYTELDVSLLSSSGGNLLNNDTLSIMILPPHLEVFHDSSLTGLGTNSSPLSVVGEGPAIAKMIAFAEDVIESITITTQSVYEEIDTTTLSLADDGDSVDFTITNGNRLRYDGTITKDFIAVLNFSGEKIAGGGGLECNFSLFKNGTIKLNGQSGQVMLNSQRSNCQTFQKVSLATNDYIVAKIKNNSSDDSIQLDDISIYITEF